MNTSSQIIEDVIRSGFHCFLYPETDDRFSSLVPSSDRILCCLSEAVKGGELSPVGLALIVYAGTWSSIVYTFGGVTYLCPQETSLPSLVIDALSASTEQPTASIDPVVLARHNASELDVYSVLSRSNASRLDTALGENVQFNCGDLLNDIRTHTVISVDVGDNGVVQLKCASAKALGFVQDRELAINRWQFAVLRNLTDSTGASELLRLLLKLPDWTVYHDIFGKKLDVDS